MSKTNKYKSVSEQIAQLIAEENESQDEIESLVDESKEPAVVDFDENEYQLPSSIRNTEFRKRNVQLLSERSSRYSGKVTSRAELELSRSGSNDEETDLDNTAFGDGSSDDDDDYDEDDEDIDDDDNEMDDFDGNLCSDASMDNSEMESEEDEETDIATTKDTSRWDVKNDLTDININDMKIVNKVDVNKEIQKGNCVKNQLTIWERLLELRIHSQKLISKANELPKPAVLKEQLLNNKYEDITQDTCKNLHKLLENLWNLKTSLIEQNSEMRNQFKLNQTQTENQNYIPKDYDLSNAEPLLKQINKSIHNRCVEQFQQYRNSVLLKWDDRTKIPLNAKQNKSSTGNYDILSKISNSLMDKQRLLQKSQMLKIENNNKAIESVRSISNIPNDSNAPSTLITPHKLNPEIYNDSDFYHHQLRELIEYKSNISDNSNELKKAYAELRQYRQQIKRKVDTRASKGRKLRYKVHNELMNFMAPFNNTTWNNDTINELSKSLFL